MAKKKSELQSHANNDSSEQFDEVSLTTPTSEDVSVAESPLPIASDDIVNASDALPVEAPDKQPLSPEDAPPADEAAFLSDVPPSDGYGDLLHELSDSAQSKEVSPSEAPLELPPLDALSPIDGEPMLPLSGDTTSPAQSDEISPQSTTSAASNLHRERILTIDARDEIQTEVDREAAVWHEIQNSYRTRRIVTGTLDGIERTESGLALAVVNYKGVRVAIPIKEMMLYTERMPTGKAYAELMEQLNRILNSRLGAEIDFIVKGYDNSTHSVVASRKDAMLRKRQTFYLDTDALGETMIYEGRVVQARVVAVAEKIVRVEVFGVECSIRARDLSWEWIGNARDHFSVGDRVLVRVLSINRPNVEDITITADIRSVSSATNCDNLKKCVPQARYAGRITDVRNGVVYLRLNNGVNAIAHSCYDRRTPGKNDDVSFAVTRLDEAQGVAVGIITRIIKQNL